MSSERLIRWIARFSTGVALFGILLAFVGAYFSAQLYRNLRSDMEELLPRDARSVMDLSRVTGRLESNEMLAVLVFSENRDASKRFVRDLAQRVRSGLGDQVARVEFEISREIEFFQRRKALFIDLPDLRRIRNYVQDRINYERETRNPLNIFSEVDLKEPYLDVGSIEEKYSNRAKDYTRFKDGYYANADESVRTVLVYLPGKSTGIEASKRLMSAVQKTVSELNPKSYSSDLEVKYTGNVANLVEENAALIQDLEISSILVAVLVSAILLWFFRSFRATFALTASLFCGTLWTFGVSYFAVGYLNANSAFMGSIVLGNGINFGIIVLARYLEVLRHHGRHAEALLASIRDTRKATLVAALAAGLAYGSLVLTGFRGFRQFGVIGFIGMLLCWLSAYTVLPAFLCLIERWRPIRPESLRSTHGYFSLGMASLVNRWPRTILLLSFALLGGSVFSAVSYRGELIETDTKKLRDRRSVESGSDYLSRYLDEIFGRYLSPIAVMPETLEQSKNVEALLKEDLEHQGNPTLLKSVRSMREFVPSRQEQKIQVLMEIRALLTPEVLRALSAKERKRVSDFLSPEAFRSFDEKDLPPAVLSRFRERDGTFGKIVLAEPTTDPNLLRIGDNQVRLVEMIRQSADQVNPGTPVAGTLPVTVDMYQAVRRDGPRATLFAFVAVILLLLLLFRRPKDVALAAFALILGLGWLFGALLTWDFKINFLNFIALPITFGIGVDYAVNIFQRYRVEGSRSIVEVIRSTGGAVSLASLTTIIGYGSLLMAGSQAFFSFGRLAILGEFACLISSVLSLPALLILIERRRSAARRGEEMSEDSSQKAIKRKAA